MTMSGDSSVRERQGHLGDLSAKTKPQLEELLGRQKKLLANVQFINSLPDQGNKISAMIGRIEAALSSLKNVDNTAELLERMIIDSDKSHRDRTSIAGGATEDVLRNLATRDESDQVVVDERLDSELPKYVNSYDKVTKRSEKVVHKAKFHPNRTMKKRSVEASPDIQRDVVRLDMPAALPNQPTPPQTQPRVPPTNPHASHIPPQFSSDANSHRAKLRHHYDENLETEVYSKERHYDGALMISVEESVDLQRSQLRNVQELQAKSAAEKLTQRLGIKMDSFNPEGKTQTSYREQSNRDSDDDDDDDDNNEFQYDYPD